MRLICPNCDAQYEVDASMLPPEGRDVQCSACGKVWFFTPPVAPPPPIPVHIPSPERARAQTPARGAPPPVAEARFLSDDDLEDDLDERATTGPEDDLSPSGPQEWQKAWDRALGKTAPAADAPEAGQGSKDQDAGLDRDFGTDYDDELNDLAARAEPMRSRTEIAARRASDVLAQDDPQPAAAQPSAAKPINTTLAERHPAATPEEAAPAPEASPHHAADPYDNGMAAEAALSSPPFAAHGLDEPRFDDSLQNQSPGVTVPTTAHPDLMDDAPRAPRGDRAEPQDGLDPLEPEDFPTEALLRRLRRSRPELPPEEPEDDFEPYLDEAEGVDPLPRRPKLDEDKLALLREEAERETRARALEAARATPRPLETQPDLGLPEAEPPARLHIGPRSTAPDPELTLAASASAAPPQSRGPRRELLPDIERINQTLSASGTGRGKAISAAQEAAEAQRKGFRRGFTIALAIALLLLLLYQNAAPLAERMPGLRPGFDGYVALVDGLRLGIDQMLRYLFGGQSL